ncbi:unnamed protein product [Acanthosepion pharaonis]|uniref:Uncharacterized protein n=1 Tax=Acanthosepion pharaonis TaxID=158019 RepID=A0A812E0E7_ACAPH|nr:unnamed protein product [Sepia pharaonis]
MALAISLSFSLSVSPSRSLALSLLLYSCASLFSPLLRLFFLCSSCFCFLSFFEIIPGLFHLLCCHFYFKSFVPLFCFSLSLSLSLSLSPFSSMPTFSLPSFLSLFILPRHPSLYIYSFLSLCPTLFFHAILLSTFISFSLSLSLSLYSSSPSFSLHSYLSPSPTLFFLAILLSTFIYFSLSPSHLLFHANLLSTLISFSLSLSLLILSRHPSRYIHIFLSLFPPPYSSTSSFSLPSFLSLSLSLSLYSLYINFFLSVSFSP